MPADAPGNNGAFICMECSGLVLAVLRGSSAEKPVSCWAVEQVAGYTQLTQRHDCLFTL